MLKTSRILILALMLLLAPFVTSTIQIGQVFAQEIELEAIKAEFAKWAKVATRAETAIALENASNEAFEDVRAEVTEWRARFAKAQGANTSRIDTIQKQIAAIGLAPENGTIELAEITQRRKVLNEQLGKLEAPALAAAEAHSRADGIIGEIDEIVRERRKNRLWVLGPSPLNPTHWFTAFKDIEHSIKLAAEDIRSNWLLLTRQETLRDSVPKMLLLFAISLILLMRSRKWVVQLTLRIQSRSGLAYQRLIEFVVSTGQVILPVIGIYAFSEAMFSTGLMGGRSQITTLTLPQIALVLFSARWLAIRMFPLSENRASILKLPDLDVTKIRTSASALGFFYGLHILFNEAADIDVYSHVTQAVLQFPLLLVCGYLLHLIGTILLESSFEPTVGSSADANFASRAISIVGQFLRVVGIAGPIMAAVGFHTAAVSVVYPTIASLGLIVLMTLLSGVIRDVYSLLTKSSEEFALGALVPVLLNFVMFILSLPLFALIWGARVSELTEIWTKFSEGFVIGDTRISPSQFFTFVLIFVVGYIATRLIQATLKGSVLPKTKLDPGAQVAVVSGLGYLGIFLAALVAISTAGINLSSIAIVAGALSVGIGFGLQTIVSNFVSGVILLIERPISEGDWIEVGTNMGIVREISVRATRIETFDKTDVIIPNSDLVSGTVTNYTRGNVTGRAIVSVGVAYGTDTRKVEQILLDIAKAHPMVLLEPGPSVHFVGFGADSLDFQIRAIVRNINFGLAVKTEMRHQIVEQFAKENIEIPFAQRDVWLRNPEVLKQDQIGMFASKSQDEDT